VFAGLPQLAFFGRKEKRQEKTDSSATVSLPPNKQIKQTPPLGQHRKQRLAYSNDSFSTIKQV
jgi:hypothetical protein